MRIWRERSPWPGSGLTRADTLPLDSASRCVVKPPGVRCSVKAAGAHKPGAGGLRASPEFSPGDAARASRGWCHRSRPTTRARGASGREGWPGTLALGPDPAAPPVPAGQQWVQGGSRPTVSRAPCTGGPVPVTADSMWCVWSLSSRGCLGPWDV